MGCSTSSSVGDGQLREVDFHKKYELGKKLGAGNFGQVRTATDREGGVYAAKILHFTATAGGLSLKEAQETFRLESALWKRSQGSPNIVEFFESFGARETYYIVMEKCKCSVLDGLKGQCILMEDVSRVFREMALGLAHVHAARIVHRDVKPDNFLLGGPDEKTVKLTDFGLASAMPKDGLLKGFAGTAPYVSPEMLGTVGYGAKTDVWSLGVTAYVMLFGDYPYMPKERSCDAMKTLIRKGSPAPTFKSVVNDSTVPNLATEFAKTMLERNAAARPSMAEVPKLGFLKTDELPEVSRELETHALGAAWTVTKSYKKRERPVDPTVQRNLDELLQRLQENQHGVASDASPSWFSETPQRTEPESSQSMEFVAAVTRKKSRNSTHSGLVPHKNSDLLDSNSVTDCSTTATTSPMTPL